MGRILRYLLIFVPIAVIAEYVIHNDVLIFVTSAIALIPLAGVLGEATEELALHYGPKIGGLLNATLGNAAELIITIVALQAGKYELVKASLTGSIIGNLLLILGVILIPIVGNVAEHLVGVQAAMKNQMDLSMTIALGSSMQIALFVAPLLVFVSMFVGPAGRELTLFFSLFEVMVLGLAVLIASFISLDGESNWLEGAMLLAVYVIAGIGFFYIT